MRKSRSMQTLAEQLGSARRRRAAILDSTLRLVGELALRHSPASQAAFSPEAYAERLDQLSNCIESLVSACEEHNALSVRMQISLRKHLS